MGEKPKLKVWWIPQVPGKAFEVPVDSVAEGVRVMDVLGNYDLFQYENRIKPDYCNAGGLLMFDEHEQEWTGWCDGETWEDDPRAFVAEHG